MAVVLLVLALAVAASVRGGRAEASGVSGWTAPTDGVLGILQAVGLLFFAFAGYARIATLGEEVRDPQRTIPRAILIALGTTVLVYAVVAGSVLLVLGADGVAATNAPLAEAVSAGSWDWAGPVVRFGAAAASLGALLALIAGIGRTTLAMARHDDLPRWLSAVHPRFGVPHRAEVALAVVVCVLIAAVDLRAAIGFSSFGVLIYYLIANLSAFTQPRADRRFPRALQIVGALGCGVLVVTLPTTTVLTGLAVFAVGLGYRLVRLRLSPS